MAAPSILLAMPQSVVAQTNVKFWGDVVSIAGHDYLISVKDVRDDPSRTLKKGDKIWVPVGSQGQVIGKVQVGSFVEVYGERDPYSPQVMVYKSYHHIKLLDVSVEIWLLPPRLKVGASTKINVIVEPERQVDVVLLIEDPNERVTRLNVVTDDKGFFSKDFTADKVGEWQIKASVAGSKEASALLICFGNGWIMEKISDLFEMYYHPGDWRVARTVERIRGKAMIVFQKHFTNAYRHQLAYYVTYGADDPELPYPLNMFPKDVPGGFKQGVTPHLMFLAPPVDYSIVMGGFNEDRFEYLNGALVFHEFMHYVQDAYWDDFGLLYGVYLILNQPPDVMEGIPEYVARQFYPHSKGSYDPYFAFIDFVVKRTGGNNFEVLSRIMLETSRLELPFFWESMNAGFKRSTGRTLDEWRKAFNTPFQTRTLIILQEKGRKLLLHVYDEQGRHVGFNKNLNAIEINIPKAEYYDLGRVILVGLPTEIRSFRCTVDADRAEQSREEFTVYVVYGQEKLVSETVNGDLSKGATRTYSVALKPEKIEVSEQPSDANVTKALVLTLVAVGLLLGCVFVIKKRRTRRLSDEIRRSGQDPVVLEVVEKPKITGVQSMGRQEKQTQRLPR